MARLCHRIFSWMGWSFVGALPDVPKFVLIGFPHTTNWDFFLYLAAVRAFRLDARFLAAEGLFKGPFGWVLHRVGGIPVGEGRASLVDDAAAAFAAADEMVLVISPEGTRRRVEVWKSGFWRIADAAGVPVVIGRVDGSAKTVAIGPAVRIDGDTRAVMDAAREFLDGAGGLRPHNAGPVALADEVRDS